MQTVSKLWTKVINSSWFSVVFLTALSIFLIKLSVDLFAQGAILGGIAVLIFVVFFAHRAALIYKMEIIRGETPTKGRYPFTSRHLDRWTGK